MELISLRTPLALLLISLGTIAAVWWWLATPINLARAPIDPNAKLLCVSYAPFRDAQTPLLLTTHIAPEQIAQDLAQLAADSAGGEATGFDGAYSNFGALNCLPDLRAVSAALAPRLRPGGLLVAAVIGRHCPWELVFYLLRGDRVERRAVKVGTAPGDEVTVLAGLSPGDQVVVEGPADLQDGGKVVVK